MGNGRLGVRLAGLVLSLGLFGGATAALAASTAQSGAKLDARCAGDSIFGELSTNAPAGTTFVLALYQEPVRQGPWLATGKTVLIVTRRRQRSYPFSFDVASYGAWAYAIKGASRNEIVSGASCAPGHQVPEAPNPLLLAAAAAGVFGVSLARRRRRRCIR
jgi:hypothetical protein